MKKIPMRRCLVTGESFPKGQLLRIVRTPEGEVKVDLTGKLNGKGAYISKNLDILKDLKEKKLLNKALEIDINDDIYKEIENILSK